MSLKISSDWRGKFQHVLTDMKSRFKVNENSDKTSKQISLYLQFVGKK